MRLEVTNLSRHFGALRAVDGLSFAVETGQICGFVGPNGAGKTTTMRIIAGVDAPTSGEVFVDGISVLEYPEKTCRHVGFMPDDFFRYPNLTVGEYLDFFAAAYGLRGRAKRARIETIAGFLDLGELRDRRCDQLSKGMAQRLSLARALVHDPEILVLDEPAAGLDPRSRIQLRELLRVLGREGKAILVSSHILTELSEICDSVVIIERGKLRASGSVSAIMARLRPHARLRMHFVRAPRDPVRYLLEQPHVAEASGDGAAVTATFTGSQGERAALLERLVREGFAISEFYAEQHDLEDIFLSVTEGGVQ